MRRIAAGILMTSLVATVSSCSSTDTTRSAPPVTCRSVSGINDVNQLLTISGCTGSTGGGGTVAAPFFSPSVIHWSGGGTTEVVFDPTPKLTSTATCANQATVTGGKVDKSTVPSITGAFHVSFCISSAGAISLAPGTKMRF